MSPLGARKSLRPPASKWIHRSEFTRPDGVCNCLSCGVVLSVGSSYSDVLEHIQSKRTKMMVCSMCLLFSFVCCLLFTGVCQEVWMRGTVSCVWVFSGVLRDCPSCDRYVWLTPIPNVSILAPQRQNRQSAVTVLMSWPYLTSLTPKTSTKNTTLQDVIAKAPIHDRPGLVWIWHLMFLSPFHK